MLRVFIKFVTFNLIFITFVLNSNNTDNNNLCKRSLIAHFNILIHNYADSFSLFSENLVSRYSGKNLNDLGDYNSCVSLNKNLYYLISIHDTSQLAKRIGLCLPTSCQEIPIDQAKAMLIDYINQNLDTDVDEANIKLFNPDEIKLKRINYVGFGIISTIFLLFASFGIYSTYKLYGRVSIDSLKQQLNSDESSINSLCVKEEKEEQDINNKLELVGSITKDNKNNTIFNKFCKAFNLRRNLNSIFVVENRSNIELFDGVKTILLLWVLMSFTYIYISLDEIKNYTEIGQFCKTFYFSIVVTGIYTFEVFLFITGFKTYIALRNNLETSFYKFLFAKPLVILPIYMFSIFAFTFTIPLSYNGPNYNNRIIRYCPKTWWKNLLFINNFFDSQECGVHLFFIALEMQLYLLFILFWFCLMKHFRKCGNATLIILATLGIGFELFYTINFSISIFNIEDALNPDGPQSKYDFFNDYLYKPYNHLFSFILGVIAAQFYLKADIGLGLRIAKSKRKWISLLILSLFLILGSIGIVYPLILNTFNWSHTLNGFIIVFGKYMFLVGLAIIFQLMFLDKLVFAKRFLSYELFGSISKLANGIYISFLFVISAIQDDYPSSFYLSHLDITVLSIAFLAVSIFASIIMTPLFYYPFKKLLKSSLNIKTLNY